MEREQAKQKAFNEICKLLGYYKDRPIAFGVMFDAGYAAGQQQWVDVADGLPITSGLYWTVCTSVDKQLFDSVRFDALTGKWKIAHHKLIEAWMPIPPYQRKSEEQNDER